MGSQLPTDVKPARSDPSVDPLAALLADDASRTGRSTTPQSGAEDSIDFIRIVHRALRGHYRIAIVTAVLIGAIGALEGWRFAGPIYRSDGMVRIASALPSLTRES